MEEMNKDEFLFFLYAMEELLESGNIEGAKRAVQRAVQQSERKEKKEE